MQTLSLQSVYHPKDPARRYKGIAIVIGLHLVIGYAIITGTTSDGLKTIKQRIETVVIDEPVIPPPPPPPTQRVPLERSKTVVQETYVQPPDAAPSEVSQLTIEAKSEPPTEPVQIALAQPQVAQTVTKVTSSDLRVACPSQAAPEMPRKAIQDGTEGVVKASALIKDGVIRDITILSGPRVFHGAVKAAMQQYKCTASAGEIVATQEFVFKLE